MLLFPGEGQMELAPTAGGRIMMMMREQSPADLFTVLIFMIRNPGGGVHVVHPPSYRLSASHSSLLLFFLFFGSLQFPGSSGL